jgi:hypothetical protein
MNSSLTSIYIERDSKRILLLISIKKVSLIIQKYDSNHLDFI